MLRAVREVLTTLEVADSDIPLGVAFPAIVKHGRTMSAANVADTWIGFEAEQFFEDGLGRDIHFANDADVAGVAEARFGAARGARGLTILDPRHRHRHGAALRRQADPERGARSPAAGRSAVDAEAWAAYSAMERDALSWKKWATRLQWYYSYVEFLLSPDLFIVGGGVSKHSDEFLPLLDIATPIVPARHRNNAGIIGAAALALEDAS